MVNLKNNILTLVWEGPYTIKSKELFDEERPGLYLFTVKTNESYSVHYIGMSRSLTSRIVGELRDYISGRYYLYNSDKLKLNIKEEDYHLKDYYEEFFSNLEKYQTIARNFLESISFFLCTFDKNTTYFNENTTYFEIAESILISHIFSNKQDFLILDNSKKISKKIYGCGLSINNEFPKGVSVTGLTDLINAPV